MRRNFAGSTFAPGSSSSREAGELVRAVQFGIIAGCRDPVDFVSQDYSNPRSGTHGKARDVSPGILSKQAQDAFGHADFGVCSVNLFCSFDGSGKPLIVNVSDAFHELGSGKVYGLCWIWTGMVERIVGTIPPASFATNE